MLSQLRGEAPRDARKPLSIQNDLFNSVGDRTILVRSDEDLTLGGVESELVHGGGRRIARGCGENLREGSESGGQLHGSGSHLV